MQVTAKFTHDKVRFDQDNNVHLVTTLKAPLLVPVSKRPAVCVTVACDVSGSMAGEKLDYAKKTLCKLIEHLQIGDSFGLVAFDSLIEVVIPTQEITQTKKEDFKSKVNDLEHRGSTNLSGGMLEALSLANKMDLPEGAVNRVIVLTDGHPNVGTAVLPEQLTAALAANMGKASVSMFGYGHDTNHDLLGMMAKIGKGNFAFIKNPDDAVTAFAKELGGLLSTYAQNVKIEVQAQNGHEVTEVLSDVDAEESENNITVSIPELLSEEERNIVFAVKLSKQKKALPRATTAFNVKVSYSTLDENGKKLDKTENIKASVQLVKAGEEQTTANADVDKLVGIAQLVKAQIEAEKAAKRGEYKTAGSILANQAVDFTARGLINLSAASHNMGANFATAAGYTKSAGLRRALRSSGTRSYSTSSADAEVQAYYGGMNMSFSNNSQAATVESFSGANSGVAVSSDGSISIQVADAPKVVTTGAAGKQNPDHKAETGVSSDPAKKKISKKRSVRW